MSAHTHSKSILPAFVFRFCFDGMIVIITSAINVIVIHSRFNLTIRLLKSNVPHCNWNILKNLDREREREIYTPNQCLYAIPTIQPHTHTVQKNICVCCLFDWHSLHLFCLSSFFVFFSWKCRKYCRVLLYGI